VSKTDEQIADLKLAKNDTDTWLAHLNDAQGKWLAYRDAHCEFHTYLNRGGTIQPLVWRTAAIRLTQLRTADLESWLKEDSEK
jgi:uncharacterized protein YecT (DUF1311 family)